MEINTKSSQNVYEMHKFINFYRLMKKKLKKLQNYRKRKQIFGKICMEFDGCHGNVDNDKETMYR